MVNISYAIHSEYSSRQDVEDNGFHSIQKEDLTDIRSSFDCIETLY